MAATDIEGVSFVKIIRNTNLCQGCKACALACSLHHTGGFNPEAGSIRVKRHNPIGYVEWSIDSTCDSCEGEDEPLCVKYCVYNALSEVK